MRGPGGVGTVNADKQKISGNQMTKELSRYPEKGHLDGGMKKDQKP